MHETQLKGTVGAGKAHILSFYSCLDGELLLASCSQDCLIRVWRLFAKTAAEPEQQTDTVIKMKQNVFEVSGDGEGGFQCN